MLQSAHNGTLDPTILFVSDGAWFHLNGFVNSQNTCHWNTENPHTVYEVPLHAQRVGVWYEVSGQGITGPIFFMTP
jgi:hypothetical protein